MKILGSRVCGIINVSLEGITNFERKPEKSSLIRPLYFLILTAYY
jgi:hypothetical protein